jgi:hypothetical protein
MAMDEPKHKLLLFERQPIRTEWDDAGEKWWFSIADICAVLTGCADGRKYWSVLKSRLKKEGCELTTICSQLKMQAADGKFYKTDAADAKQILRIIQSIPSKKAEPFKMWLAKVGSERIQETMDPEQSIDRARENWLRLGRSEKWVQQRMSGQETRNKLTDYWKNSGVKEHSDFAALTNIIHQEWTGLTVQEHKSLKNIRTQNLRDHMSEAELIFTALAELSTRQIAESEKAKGYKENATASKKGGKVAKNARYDLESKTGKSVVTGENFLPPSDDKKKLES